MNAEHHLLEAQHSIHSNASDEKFKAMIHEHIAERQGAEPQVPSWPRPCAVRSKPRTAWGWVTSEYLSEPERKHDCSRNHDQHRDHDGERRIRMQKCNLGEAGPEESDNQGLGN